MTDLKKKKIRFLYKNIHITKYSILSSQLNLINYSTNYILKKKHYLYKLLKQRQNIK